MIIAQRKVDPSDAVDDIENITWQQSLLMGFAQSIALIPGTSRSGITTLAGIGLGLNKYTAFEYSLVLGLPVLVGSSLWTIYEDLAANGIPVLSGLEFSTYLNTGIILLVPFLVGCLSLIILKKIKRDKWLSVFGIYRIGLGTLILIFTYLL
jgi:undecaprenyl-diphosphatase